MKKLVYAILIYLSFLTCVFADVQGNIESAVSTANNHIIYYDNYNLYIVTDNTKYAFNDGVLSSNSKYINGGLLNKDEYDMTLDNGETYLNDGLSYWTMTESEGFNYYISDASQPILSNSGTNVGVRPTQFIQEDTEVVGKGTYNDPWTFVEKSSVNIINIIDNETNSEKKMNDLSYEIGYGENKTISIDLPVGRKIDTSKTPAECSNGLNYTYAITSTGIKLILEKVKKASTCSLNTTDITYGVNVSSTNASQGNINPTGTQNVAHGTGVGFSIIPASGYKYSSNTCNGIMSAVDRYMTISNVTANVNCTVSFEKSSVLVTLNPNGGSCSTSAMEVNINSTYYDLPTPTRTGYVFNGWYTASSGGNKVTNSTIVTEDKGNHTLYAQWTIAKYTYTVNHYLMNISGEYELSSTQSFSDNYNTTLTLTNLIYTTPTYNVAGGIAYSYGTVNGTKKTSHVLTENATVNLYYARSQYTVTVNRGTGVSSVTGAGQYYYGKIVLLEATASTYYKFYYYSKNGSKTYDKLLSFTMGTSSVIVDAYATKCTPEYYCSVGDRDGNQCYVDAYYSEVCACKIVNSGSILISSTGYHVSLSYPACGYHACTSSCTCNITGANFIAVSYSDNYGNYPHWQNWAVKYYGGYKSNDGNENWVQWKFTRGSVSTSYVNPNSCSGTVDWNDCGFDYYCTGGRRLSGGYCYFDAESTTPLSC